MPSSALLARSLCYPWQPRPARCGHRRWSPCHLYRPGQSASAPRGGYYERPRRPRRPSLDSLPGGGCPSSLGVGTWGCPPPPRPPPLVLWLSCSTGCVRHHALQALEARRPCTFSVEKTNSYTLILFYFVFFAFVNDTQMHLFWRREPRGWKRRWAPRVVLWAGLTLLVHPTMGNGGSFCSPPAGESN